MTSKKFLSMYIWALIIMAGSSFLYASAIFAATVAGDFQRSIPRPHPDHPGNIFLAGQTVHVRLPAGLPAGVRSWQMEDDQGRLISKSVFTGTAVDLSVGELPVGWYNIKFLDANDKQVARTTAAVLAPLKAPIPLDSPICVDAAISWFAKNDLRKQEYFASLAALAGVNWVRDRLTWQEIQPAPGRFAPTNTTYDTAAEIQAGYGLQVLQVFHYTPDWAVNRKLDPKNPRARFPRNLLDLYRFCRHLSRRFHGRVQAWEPWNEANIHNFGGQTIDEMCSLQKAAYLGFKAGDSAVTVGWNACAGLPSKLHTEGLLQNEAWSYFDTYNFHSYDWPHSYRELWPPAVQAACGRPVWITESDRGMKYVTPPPWCDLDPAGEIKKAALIAQEYACSFAAGSRMHFHFILGHYFEHNGVQFGLLRLDYTPRPAYVALAALGRILAGARYLGRWQTDAQDIHAYCFRSRPDGRKQDVMVAWAEKQVDWPQRGKTVLPWKFSPAGKVVAVYDYLGRKMAAKIPPKLTGKPVYIILPPGTFRKSQLEPQPSAAYKPSKISPVVLQGQFEQKYSHKFQEKQWSEGYLYQLQPDKTCNFTICVYNFADAPIQGTVRAVNIPAGWQITPLQWHVALEPLHRLELPASVKVDSQTNKTTRAWLKFTGSFPPRNPAVLAVCIEVQ